MQHMGHTRRLMCLWDGDGIGASEEQEPSLSWIIHATIIAEFLLRPMASSSPFSGTLDSEQPDKSAPRCISLVSVGATRVETLGSKVASSRAKKALAPTKLASRFVVRDTLHDMHDMQGESLV